MNVFYIYDLRNRLSGSTLEIFFMRAYSAKLPTDQRGVEQEAKEAGVIRGSLEASAQDRVKWKQFVGSLCSTSGATKA